MARELQGKVAVVTGATRQRGLGRALALCLARGGANVTVTGAPGGQARLTNDELKAGWRGLESVVEEINGVGSEGLGVFADISVKDDVERMVRETVDTFGRLDILVNNAAYPRASDRVPLVDLADETWRQIVATNLTGTMLCCKYVARQLIHQGQGGSIVSISSTAAMTAKENFSAYATSKLAVHALSGVLAAELAPHAITCNVVAPGFLDTSRIDMLRTESRWQQRLSAIPLGRAGTPEEVGEMVRFLCGPNARWITGEVIVIAGGEVRRTGR